MAALSKYILASSILCYSLHGFDVFNFNDLQEASANGETDVVIVNPIFVPSTQKIRPWNINNNFTPNPITTNISTTPGNAVRIDGLGRAPGMTIGGGTVNIKDLEFQVCVAKGGQGGHAGAGAGMGGALYIRSGAIVNLEGVQFFSCQAIGGDTDGVVNLFEGVITGGGGTGGKGGISQLTGNGTGFLGGGGGGGWDLTSLGGNSQIPDGISGGGGGGGGSSGAGSSTTSASSAQGGANFGGGMVAGGFGGATLMGGAAAIQTGGGGGGAGSGGNPGGDGLDFGGGGGGSDSSGTPSAGGNGGFGGGGGAGGVGFTIAGGMGGMGGFGGGGGGGGGALEGGSPGSGGVGGFGGGSGGGGTSIGITGGGGAGAGFGGAIFLEPTAELTIGNGAFFEKATAIGGIAGNVTGASDGEDGQGMGQAIFMMSSSQITFNIDSGLFVDAIEGDQGAGGGSILTGGLIKNGSGKLTIGGDNTYTGGTTINGGMIEFLGSTLGDTNVGENGELDVPEEGTDFGGNVENSGTVAVRTPTAGKGGVRTSVFTQTNTGTLEQEVSKYGESGGQSPGPAVAAGVANLGGAAAVEINSENYLGGSEIPLVQAETINGGFSAIQLTTEDGTPIPFTGTTTLTITESSIFEIQNITNSTAKDVAQAFRDANITIGSDFATMTLLLGALDDEEVNVALVDISPVRYGSLEWINARNNSYVADILSQHAFELCCSPRNCCSCECDGNVWLAGFGNFMNQHSRYDRLPRYDADAGGLVLGMDFCNPCGLYYGAAVGWTRSHFNWKPHKGNGNINSYYGAIYGSWLCGCGGFDFSLIGGASDNDTSRKIQFTNVKRTARGDFWNQFVTVHLGTQFDWQCGCTVFEPIVLVDYHYFARNSFKEKGANSLNLKMKSFDQHILRFEGGINWYWISEGEDCCYAPYIGVSYVGEYPLTASKQKASFSGQSNTFTVKSYDSAVNLVSPQAGVKYTNSSGTSFVLEYKGLYNGDFSANQCEARVELIF